MMSKRILVTAGLPYSNGRLHVGHIAGAYLPADIYVRFMRLNGKDVRYVCGSDDHGVAIKLTAEKEGKNPGEVAKYYNECQQRAFEGLGIRFDVFGATSQTKSHTKTSQDFFLNLHGKGYFEKVETRQFYDETKQMFLPDRYVKGTCKYCHTADQNSDQCENCGKILDIDTLEDVRSTSSGGSVSAKQTVHWFLDLSKVEQMVENWLAEATIRDHTKNYVKGLLKTGLVKRSMTRDLDWGVPLPIDDPDAKDKVLYVWFDAPIGYVSNTKEMCEKETGYEGNYVDWWKSPDCDIVHFIGEDNTIFHCIIWIAMLSAEGSFSLPSAVIVNQFLNIKFPGKEEEKISKSRGTAVWIEDYCEQGGNPDSLRYYLTLIAPEKHRTAYKSDDLIERHNGELANILGNFVNRVLTFSRKFVGETVPEYKIEHVTEKDTVFLEDLQRSREIVGRKFSDFEFKNGLLEIFEFARRSNKYLDDKAPWTTRKTDMEATKVTLAYGFFAIHYMAIALYPILPFTAEKIFRMLNINRQDVTWKMDLIQPGQLINTPEILFEKIEKPKD